MSTIRWIIALLIIGLVAYAAKQSLRPRSRPPTAVQKVVATKRTLTRTVSGAGKLEPADKVNVSSNITGTLVDLKVQVGSSVKKGDLLGQIDTSLYATDVAGQRAGIATARADVARAKSALARASREVKRLEGLAKSGAASTQELDAAIGNELEARAGVDAAESRVNQAQSAYQGAARRVEFGTLRAPSDGTILAVNHRVGERIRGSDFEEDIVLTIGTVGRMEVTIEVGEYDVVFIKSGQKALIELDALPDRKIRGHVRENGRDAQVKNAGTDNEVTTYKVWIALDEASPVELSGMSAHVEIETDTRAGVLAVPIQAVTVRPQIVKDGEPPSKELDKVVFVLESGGTVAKRRKVQTGLTSETMIEIVSGLKEGEEMVEGPYRVLARQLEDGDAVVVEAAAERPRGGPQ
jgi:HlyD family secretion protein